jgi:large subunit ribosomal protein L21
MYAVIKTGGKQQKVKAGDIIEVEHLSAEGETVTFQPLLVVDDEGNTHYGKDAQGAVVTAKLLGDQKGDKVSIFKYKNKSGYARRAGHRQLLSLIEIAEVSLGSGAKKAPAKKATKASAAAAEEAPEAAEAPTEASAEALADAPGDASTEAAEE